MPTCLAYILESWSRDHDLYESPLVDWVLRLVSTHYSTTKEELTGPCRKKDIVEARHVVMYLLRVDGSLSLKEVAKIVGRTDHSTVIHGVAKIGKRKEVDKKFGYRLNAFSFEVDYAASRSFYTLFAY